MTKLISIEAATAIDTILNVAVEYTCGRASGYHEIEDQVAAGTRVLSVPVREMYDFEAEAGVQQLVSLGLAHLVNEGQAAFVVVGQAAVQARRALAAHQTALDMKELAADFLRAGRNMAEELEAEEVRTSVWG